MDSAERKVLELASSALSKVGGTEAERGAEAVAEVAAVLRVWAEGAETEKVSEQLIDIADALEPDATWSKAWRDELNRREAAEPEEEIGPEQDLPGALDRIARDYR